MTDRCQIIITMFLAIVSTCWASDNLQAEIYEMRVYYPHPGKLKALLQRFEDHTCELFSKHDMTNVGYFIPEDSQNEKLVYFMSYPDQAFRDQSWKSFMADPDWKNAFKQSRKDGPLVKKVESTFLKRTAYSPKIDVMSDIDHGVYELRTYTSSPGNLQGLNERFQDHTIALFKKHGISNIAYFNMIQGQPEADKTLIYLIAHDSIDARKASFKSFSRDPLWKAAKSQSEEKAGGSLTEKGGVKFEYLVPTAFSPLQ